MLETALDALPEEESDVSERYRPMSHFGDYQLLEEIGRGGQGIVYRARQTSLSRIVALKVIGVGSWATEKHLKRFQLEAQGAASLDCPGVVPIYETGLQTGVCYYTMKLMEGGALASIAQLPTRRAAELTARLANILGYAHEHGILHRDIKPGNILFDAKGQPHLADFGLARLVEGETNITLSDEVLGTPAYMAPEQAGGRTDAISSATDIYGLGVVLYQLLAGRLPFTGNTRYEITRSVIELAPPRPRSFNQSVDRDLEIICLKCLEKDPNHRYDSALALAEDLERWLRGEPIKARPAGMIRRSYKLLRRNPVPTASALAVLLIVAILLGAKATGRKTSPTRDTAALELFTRAHKLFVGAPNSNSGRQDMIEAASLLNQAIARDRGFVEAYCQLAWVDGQLYLLGHDHSPARLAQAEAAAQMALRLRPNAGEARLARAQILYRGHLDYDGALAELERAAIALPNDPRSHQLKGYVLRRMGRHEEALRELERSVALDPRNTEVLGQLSLSYIRLRRYADARANCDRILALDPNNVEALMTRAYLPTLVTADTTPWHDAIESVRLNHPAEVRRIADSWLMCALYERAAAWAEEALIAAGDNTPINSGPIHFNRPFAEAIIAHLEKDEPKAQAAFRVARAEQEKVIAAQPDYAPALCVLGMIDAALGRKEEALREGRQAIELLPPEKDALVGSTLVSYSAMLAAWVGERDLAFEQLAKVIHYPGVTDYGELKLSPFWDPLRDDPRFERIVASFAPQ